MTTIKRVQDGYEPWEVLYDVVCNTPELIYFHIGEVVSFQSGFRHILNKTLRYFSSKDHLLIKKHGGELLTRCDPSILPQPDIGRAFHQMPLEQMKEMFPCLLKQQLKFIETLTPEKEIFYSINLEGMDHDSLVWTHICELLLQFRQLPVNVEIKENTLLSPQIMCMLAKVCAKTTIRIYIDDLCSCCHKLPEGEDYLIMMIEELHKYIKAVKIDYMVMQQILRLDGFHCIKTHLDDFLWLWLSYCDIEPPSVIFESMPNPNFRWLKRLEELASRYKGCNYQTG